MISKSPFFLFVKRVKVIYLLYLLMWQKLAVLPDASQQFTACIAFKRGHDALLMARRVHLVCCIAVLPYTTLALVGIAITAKGCMSQLVKSLGLNIKSCLQVSDAGLCLA